MTDGLTPKAVETLSTFASALEASPAPSPRVLGVNIDHVATLRQARRTTEPSVVAAALAAERAGAGNITMHLREDRRHIQDADLRAVREAIRIPLNMEMAATDEMVKIAIELKVDQVTLVPENRQEITTEGGLAVAREATRLKRHIDKLDDANIPVFLFIGTDAADLQAACDLEVEGVEFHTGGYAEACLTKPRQYHAIEEHLDVLETAADWARAHDLEVHAGHGLTLHNLPALMRAVRAVEYNIGHSLVSRALFYGLEFVVGEFAQAIRYGY